MPAKLSPARAATPLRWGVGIMTETLAMLAGVPLGEFFRNPDAAIEVFRHGRPKARAMFGPDVALPSVYVPLMSYGHVNTLGCPLTFLDDSEPGVHPAFDSLEQGIAALRRPVDFATAGYAPLYLDMFERLKRAFPDERVTFYGFRSEGPITTAWALRGHDFFADVMDDPQGVDTFLRLITDSLTAFWAFQQRVHGHANPIDPDSAGMPDDLSSLLNPNLWPRFVVPAWDRYYRGRTSGKRSIHVENLTRGHLKYLEDVGISWYDPSVSPKLTARMIAEEIAIPFKWRLPSFSYATMTEADVRAWVRAAFADGASGVSTAVENILCDEASTRKIHAFIDEAKAVTEAQPSARAAVAAPVS